MRAAIIVPDWFQPPSGGRRALHQVSAALRKIGVDAVTVGRAYDFEKIDDKVIPPRDYEGGDDVALILPEGYNQPEAVPYYYRFVMDKPHGAAVVYCQSCDMMDEFKEWETHYWGLGNNQRLIVRARAGVPDEIPVEELLPPLDFAFWTTMRLPWQGSFAYCPNRGTLVLDRVARRCGTKPVFRINGANREQVRSMLARADIFVLASKAEGISSIMCEAMAMECAIVTWPSGGLTDVIQHERNGLMVQQDDIVGLEECVQRFQQNPEYSRRLAAEARRWTEENLAQERFEARLADLWAKIT